MKLVGAVSKTRQRARELAQAVAIGSAQEPRSVAEEIFSSDSLSLWALRRPDEAAGSMLSAVSPDGRERFWLAGDFMEAPRRPAPIVPDVAHEFERLRGSVEGDWLGVQVSARGSVTLLADSWGLSWVFVRRLADAAIFSHDFAALCRIPGSTLSTDPDCLLLELGMGFVPDDRTIFREITVLTPGGGMHIEGNETALIAPTEFQYGIDHAHTSLEEKFRLLDGLFETMADRVIRLAEQPLSISLSAGIDSRYALAWLSRKSAVAKLLTFGEAESDEVIGAKSVVDRLDQRPPWELFTVDGTDWDSWQAMIQALGNCGIVQWCGWSDDWLAFVRARSKHCVVGYLGDALSGKRLSELPSEHPALVEPGLPLGTWERRWLAFELDCGNWWDSPLLRAEARKPMLRAASERFASLCANASFAEPWQRAYHCNVVGRQRRWVGTQPVLLGRWLTPLLFFIDKAYRAFWMNLPLADLDRQRLYHLYSEQRFPKLFPKAPSPIESLARRVIGKLRRTISGELPVRRPPPIVRFKLLQPHFESILGLLDRRGEALEKVVHVQPLRRAIAAIARDGTESDLTFTMLFRVVNVMHLLELAESPLSVRDGPKMQADSQVARR